MNKGFKNFEELEEEGLRMDFVAFTRAKKSLEIIARKPTEYLNDEAKLKPLEAAKEQTKNSSQRFEEAYKFFVNKEYEQAKQALQTDKKWVLQYINNYFQTNDSLSYSKLTMHAHEYLENTILNLQDSSTALQTGSDVHNIAEKLLQQEQVENEEYEQYINNIKEILQEIKEEYSEVVSSEEFVKQPLKKLTATSDETMFVGYIDAVFKNDEDQYLIVDWKTSKRTNKASKHRRQLSMYKKLYGLKHDIPEDDIHVAIAYVGLQKRINDNTLRAKLDMKQPTKRNYKTLQKRLDKYLEWKTNPKTFLKDLKQTRNPSRLVKSLVEN